MKKPPEHWTSTEFKTYLLLACARSDNHEHQNEIAMIKSKTAPLIFQNMYLEFENDTEQEVLEKIATHINSRDVSPKEISSLKEEIHQVFFSDNTFNMMEDQMSKILDNILY